MYCSYRARIDAHYTDRKQSVSASEASSAVRLFSIYFYIIIYLQFLYSYPNILIQ